MKETNSFTEALDVINSGKTEKEKHNILRCIFGDKYLFYGFFDKDTLLNNLYLFHNDLKAIKNLVNAHQFQSAHNFSFHPFYDKDKDLLSSDMALSRLDYVGKHFNLSRVMDCEFCDDEMKTRSETNFLSPYTRFQDCVGGDIVGLEIKLQAPEYAIWCYDDSLDVRFVPNISKESMRHLDLVFKGLYTTDVSSKTEKLLRRQLG